jgi:chromosome segregation ATPase
LSPKDLQLLKENLADLAERVREQREAAEEAQNQQQTIKQTALSITCALMAKEFELEAAQKRIAELAGLVSLLADRCARAELSMAADVVAMKEEALKSMSPAQASLRFVTKPTRWTLDTPVSNSSVTLTAVAQGLQHLASTKPEKRASMKKSAQANKLPVADLDNQKRCSICCRLPSGYRVCLGCHAAAAG